MCCVEFWENGNFSKDTLARDVCVKAGKKHVVTTITIITTFYISSSKKPGCPGRIVVGIVVIFAGEIGTPGPGVRKWAAGTVAFLDFVCFACPVFSATLRPGAKGRPGRRIEGNLATWANTARTWPSFGR